MGRFRNWLEEVGLNKQPTILRRDQYQAVQKLYDATIKALGVGGAPKAVATTTLSDIQDTDANPAKPPSKGVRVVLNKLQHVFGQLSKVPHFEDRVADAQNWLQQLSSASSGEPRPNDNIATLLKKMFGDDALETYGERKWKGAAAPEAKAPQDNNMPGQDATAPPMAGQDGQPQPGADPTGGQPPMDPSGGMGGGQPPMDPSMGADPTGGMGGQPPMDPSGGMDPNMMAMMGGGQQQDPNAALQGPGGAFPPKPPGGLPMA